MIESLATIYEEIVPPRDEDPLKPLYAAIQVPGHHGFLVGKDREGHACLLVAASDQLGKLQSPIRLEELDVQFQLSCYIKSQRDAERLATFTVIRCRSLDGETVRYFLTICDVIVQVIGDNPTLRQVATAVHKLAAIFQRVERPPARTVSGLFGELYLIWRSRDPAKAVAAWRVDDGARFDFNYDSVRLDAKTASGRTRTHTFSYEQCNPPAGTTAIVASMFVERVPGGLSARILIENIAARLTLHPDLIFKLHEVMSGTLGTSLTESLGITFDDKLAESSLRFFRIADVPGLRGPLPDGVSDVHFRSDLSASRAASIQSLIEEDESLRAILPRKDGP